MPSADSNFRALVEAMSRFTFATDSARVYQPGGYFGVTPTDTVVAPVGAFDEAIQATPLEPLAPWEIELLSASSVSGSEVAGQTAQTEVGNPNTISEGEAMPETQTLTVQLPSTIRRTVFDTMGGANTLMSNLDLANWESVLNSLQGNLDPVQINVTRGSYVVEGQIPSQHPLIGRIFLDYLQVDEGQEVVSIASNDKMVLELLEPSLDGERPMYYTLKPINQIDRDAFQRYTGGITFSLSYENDVPRIYLNDLKSGMRTYLEYRARRRTYIRETIRTHMSSNNVRDKTPAQIAEQKQRRNANLYNFMEKAHKKAVPGDSPFSKMAILPHGTIASRRWGIEIEACDIGGIDTPEHWALHGDGSLRPASNFSAEPDVDHEDECNYWNDEDDEDCSCGADSQRERLTERNRDNIVSNVTGEWNSPILHSFHSRGLKYLSDNLVPRYTNSSAGVHVHVEAGDLTADQAVQLSMFYSALEPLFEKEYHRSVRNYCKPVDAKELLDRMDLAKTLKGKPATAFQYGRRYFTVNMAALNTHGTIEFRAMGNVYEYEHLIRWAHFCREMVNLAQANVPQKAWMKVNTFEDLIVLFAKYGKETPMPDWAPDAVLDFEPIVAMLGTESRLKPNARPSHAYTLYPGETAPVELFDDYTQKAVATTANPSRSVISRR